MILVRYMSLSPYLEDGYFPPSRWCLMIDLVLSSGIANIQKGWGAYPIGGETDECVWCTANQVRHRSTQIFVIY
jgi:hypothetical protein